MDPSETLILFLLKALLPVLALFPTSSENFITLFNYPIFLFLQVIYFSQSALITTILLLTKMFLGDGPVNTPLELFLLADNYAMIGIL